MGPDEHLTVGEEGDGAVEVGQPAPQARGGLRRPDGVPFNRLLRWAVVVGISRYRDRSLRLRYATKDAQALWDLLKTPVCGSFDEARAVVLLDAKATTAGIIRALRSHLSKAGEDDLVLIYLSGHGAEDPVSKDRVHYFLTYDTRPDDIAGSALPMRELMQSIHEYVRARHVVLLVDACHGSAVAGGKGTQDAALALDKYQSQHPMRGQEIAIFTASETREQAYEDADLGGGHGRFTHLLLEGLRARAADEDGVVRLGALFDYVQKKMSTMDGAPQQHPWIGAAPFSRDFVIAVTGVETARELLEIGRMLLMVAVRVGGRLRYAAAMEYLQRAATYAEVVGALPEANALARVCALEGVVGEQTRRSTDVGSIWPLHAAMEQVWAEDWSAAADTFEAFCDAAGETGRARWARRMAQLLRLRAAVIGGANRALFIGVGTVGAYAENDRKSALHNGRLLERALSRAGVQLTGAQHLFQESASPSDVRAALERLRVESRPEDFVLIMYTGHTLSDRFQNCIALFDDFPLDGAEPSGLTALELHEALQGIPAERKVLVMETSPRADLLALAQGADASYLTLYACSQGQVPQDLSIIEVDRRIWVGAATWALTSGLENIGDLSRVRMDRVVRAMSQLLAERGHPQPLHVGPPHLPLLGGRALAFQVQQLLRARLFPGEYAGAALEFRSCHAQISSGLQGAPDPELFTSLAWLYLQAGEEELARAASERAALDLAEVAEESPPAPVIGHWLNPAANLAWVRLHLACRQGHLNDLVPRCAALASTLPAVKLDALSGQLAELATTMASPRRYALVIGIERTKGEEVRRAPGARAEAELFADTLVNTSAFAREDIVLLLDENATAAAIRFEIQKVRLKARMQPAVLYYSGPGTTVKEGVALVPFDHVEDRSGVALWDWEPSPMPSNLLCVLDTDVEPGLPRYAPLRSEPDLLRPATYQAPDREQRWSALRAASFAVVVPRSGRITERLCSRLADAPHSVGEWVRAGEQRGAPILFCDHPSEPLFVARGGSEMALDMLRRFELEGLRALERRLAGLAEDRRIQVGRALIDRGVILTQVGAYRDAVECFERAMAETRSDQDSEARIELARTLYLAREQLGRAYSDLDAAFTRGEGDATTLYYLGAVIRELLDRKLLKRAQEAWLAYLNAGAPLGHREEVEAFLQGPPDAASGGVGAVEPPGASSSLRAARAGFDS